MNKLLKNFLEQYGDYLYFVFRVLVGLLFLQHGLQKLFGMFGGTQSDLTSLSGLAGIIEFIGGLTITLGLFTRLSAFISGGLMTVAYFMVHAPQGFFPIQNKGELALLYFACFIVIFILGSKKLSLGQLLFKKEIL